mmetsp:Transcript_144568/g.463228  ORF Transcript_144568/g.463228 Transcript_144568/m.463228 type:complete len:89 (-) Transcript_144568:395-661(-)
MTFYCDQQELGHCRVPQVLSSLQLKGEVLRSREGFQEKAVPMGTGQHIFAHFLMQWPFVEAKATRNHTFTMVKLKMESVFPEADMTTW